MRLDTRLFHIKNWKIIIIHIITHLFYQNKKNKKLNNCQMVFQAPSYVRQIENRKIINRHRF